MKTNPYIDRQTYRTRLREIGYSPPPTFPVTAQALTAAILAALLLTFSLLTGGTTSWVLLGLTIATTAWLLATLGVIIHNRRPQ